VDSLRLNDFTAAQAGRADADPLSLTIHLRVYRTQVNIPAPLGDVMGVTDMVSGLRLLAADFTLLCHWTAAPREFKSCRANLDFTGVSPLSATIVDRHLPLCDTDPMQSPLQSPTAATDPRSVKVHLTTGSGMDIEWGDGHVSHYGFVFLRDACPCAMCEEERGKSGRRPGDPATAAPGALLMFKPTAKPLSAEGVGKYAIKFSWNDNHDLGIYSWKFLREVCPCEECANARSGS